MRSSDQNIRKQRINDLQAYSRKYSYLSNENVISFNQESTNPIILQTISEQALSQDKGSVSNRSQSNPQNTNRIHKNLSERIISNNRSPQFKTQANVSRRNLNHTQDIFNPIQQSSKHFNPYAFEKKSVSIQRANQDLGIPQVKCYQCAFNSHKIAELQSSYQLLLSAKNEELQDCKMIILGLEDKLRQVEKKSQQEIEKNKKFRSQIQRKNHEELYVRDKQNDMIEYLKNRQIVLLEQMKELENEIYVKEIKSTKTQSIKSQTNSLKKLNFNINNFNSTNNQVQCNLKTRNKENQVDSSQEQSVSQYSAKNFEQQFELNHNGQFSSSNLIQKSRKYELYGLDGPKKAQELVQRVPLSEILKKSNLIECLKDDLLVSQLKIKLQQTKTLEEALHIK